MRVLGFLVLLGVLSCGQAPAPSETKPAPQSKCPPVPECEPPKLREGEAPVLASHPKYCSATGAVQISCLDLDNDGCIEARSIQCGGPKSCEGRPGAASCKAKLNPKGEQAPLMSVGYVSPGKSLAEGFTDGEIPLDKATKRVKLTLRTYGYLMDPISLQVKLINDAGQEAADSKEKIVLETGSDGFMYTAIEVDATRLLEGGAQELIGEFIMEDVMGQTKIRLDKKPVRQE